MHLYIFHISWAGKCWCCLQGYLIHFLPFHKLPSTLTPSSFSLWLLSMLHVMGARGPERILNQEQQKWGPSLFPLLCPPNPHSGYRGGWASLQGWRRVRVMEPDIQLGLSPPKYINHWSQQQHNKPQLLSHLSVFVEII